MRSREISVLICLLERRPAVRNYRKCPCLLRKDEFRWAEKRANSEEWSAFIAVRSGSHREQRALFREQRALFREQWPFFREQRALFREQRALFLEQRAFDHELFAPEGVLSGQIRTR